MKFRNTAIVSSLLLAFVAGCDSQSSSTDVSGSGTTLSGVAAGRGALAGASITVLDADSHVVWTGLTDDSGRYEASLPEGVKFPVEVVALKDTLELKTLAPWEDDGDIVSNVNPVTDIAYEKLWKHHRLDSIRTREDWLRKGDSIFAVIADSLVEFEDYAVEEEFHGAHHGDWLLDRLAEAADSAREDGDLSELEELEEMVSDLSCRFERDDHDDDDIDSLDMPGLDDSLDIEDWHHGDSLSLGGHGFDSADIPDLRDGFETEPADTTAAVKPDSLMAL